MCVLHKHVCCTYIHRCRVYTDVIPNASTFRQRILQVHTQMEEGTLDLGSIVVKEKIDVDELLSSIEFFLVQSAAHIFAHP